MIGSVKHIAQNTFAKYKIISLIYLVQLGLGLLIGAQVYQVLDASFGDSMAAVGLLDGFDRTVFTDLFNYHGGSLSPLIGLLRWLILLYIPVYIFLQAGLVYCIVYDKNDLVSFFKGGAQFFKRFLGLTLISLFGMLIFSVLVWGIFAMLTRNPMTGVGVIDERPWVYMLITTGVIWVSLMIGLWTTIFIAKIHSIQSNQNILKDIRNGFQKCISKSRKLFLWTFMLIALQLLFILLGSYISEDRGAYSYIVILSLFLIQQILIWTRVFLKVFYYKGLSDISRS